MHVQYISVPHPPKEIQLLNRTTKNFEIKIIKSTELSVMDRYEVSYAGKTQNVTSDHNDARFTTDDLTSGTPYTISVTACSLTACSTPTAITNTTCE